MFTAPPHHVATAKLPDAFSVTVPEAPFSKDVRQGILPDFLRVTITYNGATEAHGLS